MKNYELCYAQHCIDYKSENNIENSKVLILKEHNVEINRLVNDLTKEDKESLIDHIKKE